MSSNINLNNFSFTNKSAYISIEGPDGIGKTTFVKELANSLLTLDYDVLSIKEPGYTKAGAIIREYLLKEERPLEDQIDFFVADRILTQNLVIKPALNKNKFIISDRSIVSSMVYQGLMNRSLDKVVDAHLKIPNFLYPDLVIVGYAPVNITTERLKKRSGESNYLDEKDVSFHLQIRDHFNNLKEHYFRPLIYINFDRPVKEIVTEVLSLLNMFK